MNDDIEYVSMAWDATDGDELSNGRVYGGPRITVRTWAPTLPVAMLLPSPEGLAVVLQPVDCIARDFVRLMMAGDARRQGQRMRRHAHD